MLVKWCHSPTLFFYNIVCVQTCIMQPLEIPEGSINNLLLYAFYTGIFREKKPISQYIVKQWCTIWLSLYRLSQHNTQSLSLLCFELAKDLELIQCPRDTVHNWSVKRQTPRDGNFLMLNFSSKNSGPISKSQTHSAGIRVVICNKTERGKMRKFLRRFSRVCDMTEIPLQVTKIEFPLRNALSFNTKFEGSFTRGSWGQVSPKMPPNRQNDDGNHH